MSTSSTWLRRVVVGFARFWWDFLVGDTPELFLGVVTTLVVISVISVVLHERAAALVALPVLVASVLALSLRRAAKRHP